MGTIIGIIIGVLVVVLLIKCIRIVPQAQCYVIEFLGSYKTTWENGLHIKIPVLERISKKVSMKEQVADFPPQPVITKDNVTMQIDTVVYYNIFDPKLFTYGVENPILALANITATTLRNIIGEMELDETLTSRDTINEKMQLILDKATDSWGIKVNRVELKNIVPPKEIQDAMEKQMKAERERRQTLLEAQGHKEAVTLRAQGDKEAQILKAEAERDAAIAVAEGKARSIKLVYEAEADGIRQLNEAKMSENVLTLKKLDAFKAVADGRATKIIIPSELAASASQLQFV
ncbi:MAG: SPFH domain-containing protein, partial [Faecalimonas sp.]|nr:SPFH domain-containing protein [Faecalimonas sp.]